MKLPRTHASLLFLGSCLAGVVAAQAAQAEDYVSGTLAPVASRCADFGDGFIDMGNGICARVGSTTRVQLGTRSVSSGTWGSGGTSSATLRSTDSMLPGVGVQHLRVRNGLDASPFQ